MNIIFIKLVAFFSLFAVGCSPVYYSPNLMNMPNFREKDEVYLAGHLASGGYDAQAAYAVTNNVFIQGNVMAYNDERTAQSINAPKETTVTKGHLGEVAAGYFLPLNKYDIFSICGGYGMGNVNNDWATQGASSARIGKLFIQPSFGTRRKYFELIMSAKLANLNYSDFSQNYTNQEFIDQFNTLKKTISIFELGMVMRLGGENVKVQLDFTSAGLLKPNPLFRYDGGSIGIGLCLQLNPKKDFFTPSVSSRN